MGLSGQLTECIQNIPAPLAPMPEFNGKVIRKSKKSKETNSTGKDGNI